MLRILARWYSGGVIIQLYVEGDKDRSPTQEELEVLLRATGTGGATPASGEDTAVFLRPTLSCAAYRQLPGNSYVVELRTILVCHNPNN